MQKWIAVFVSIQASVLPGLAAAGTSEGLAVDYITGVRLGMTITDFAKARPQAQSFKLDLHSRASRTLDVNKPDQMVIEQLTREKFFSTMMCQFTNGRLCKVILTGERDFENYRSERGFFVQRCLEKWGRRYEAKVVRLGYAKMEYYAPALVWSDEDSEVLATCTPDFEGVFPNEGQFQVQVRLRQAGCASLVLDEVKVEPQFKDSLLQRIGLSK